MSAKVIKYCWLISLGLVVVLWFMAYISKPLTLSYDKNLVTLSQAQEGEIRLEFSPLVKAYHIEKTRQGQKINYTVQAWDSLLKRILGHNQPLKALDVELEGVASIYFYDSYEATSHLIYKSPYAFSGGLMLYPKLGLKMYFALVGLLLLVLGVMWLLARPYYGLRKTLEKFMLASGAYLLGHLMVKGFDGTTYNLERDLVWILVLSASLVLSTYLFGRLINKNNDHQSVRLAQG